ncbi:NAD(P)-dependent oxidoreductase [bacterium]|nr:NAD(P)-dependent oxidoreductase [bacterium]
MRLLVTGASGFIGRNIVSACPDSWDVTATWRSQADFPAFLAEQGLDHVRPVQGDLSAAEGARAVADAVGGHVDAVLHLASSGDPAWSAEHPGDELCATALPLARLCEALTTDRLVFVSSGIVYEGLEGVVRPGMPVDPVLPYAVAKLAAEQLVRFFRRQGRVGSYMNVRFMGAYGPHEPPRKIYTRLVQAFGIEGRREYELRGDGGNWIDAMYVDDAVRGLLAMVTGAPCDQTVDFGVGVPLTLNELVRAAAAAFGIDDVHITHAGSVAESHAFRISPEPVAALYGFRPIVPLAEGLRRLHAFLTGGAACE